MSGEQETTLAALKTAIQMEIDGKAFYLESSQSSTSELGKKLFKQLASEEDLHRKTFENIYKNISASKEWPENRIISNGGHHLRTIFSQALEKIDRDVKAVPTELAAIAKAMEMENKSYDFYTRRSSLAAYSSEKEFYQEVAVQEKEHHRVLLDYYEFLKDPASWFTQKEHLSVDGG